MARHTEHFLFEHETVLGDLLDLLLTHKAQIEEYTCLIRDPDVWELQLSFDNAKTAAEFAQELGRDPV